VVAATDERSTNGRSDWLAALLFRPISALFFPSFRIRFSVALLLTFFSFGLSAIVPLPYPSRDLVDLCCWMWVFPSNIWVICLVLAPLIPTATYGYSAFNAFCLVGTLSIGYSAMRSREVDFFTIVDVFKFVRVCMFITVIVSLLQLVTGPGPWVSIFPDISLGGIGARGAGIQSEPSLLAGPLAIYCALLICRIEAVSFLGEPIEMRKRLMREGVITVLVLLAVSGSLSVLLAAIAIFPALVLRRKRILVPIIAVSLGVLAAAGIFAERLRETLAGANGSVLALMTVAAGSWRNVPDIVILQSPSDYLLPGNPVDIRVKISAHAAELSPAFAWVQNTYSTFAAGATTVGLLAVGLVAAGGFLFGKRSRSSLHSLWITWCLLYGYNWFFAPKFEAAGWVALGLLGWLSCQLRGLDDKPGITT
jgi:hypothetical protein